MCLKPAWMETESKVVRFDEWIEMQLILGVDKVFIYHYYVDESFRKVFSLYMEKGIVEIVTPFSLSSLYQW